MLAMAQKCIIILTLLLMDSAFAAPMNNPWDHSYPPQAPVTSQSTPNVHPPHAGSRSMSMSDPVDRRFFAAAALGFLGMGYSACGYLIVHIVAQNCAIQPSERRYPPGGLVHTGSTPPGYTPLVSTPPQVHPATTLLAASGPKSPTHMESLS